MAEFNPLQASEYAEAVRRLLGEDLAVGSVSPELALNLVLENNPLDWWIQHGKLPWVARQGAALLAGNFSHVGVAVRQPGLVSVVNSILIENTAAALGTFHVNLASAAVHDFENAALSRDLRTAKTAATVSWSRQQVTEIGSIVYEIQVPANSQFLLVLGDEDVFVLGQLESGAFNGIAVVPSVVGLSCVATFVGYERRMRPEELRAL